LHADRGPHRAQRVVLVGARQAEHRHDRVADVLLDLAAVACDLGGHGLEIALLDLVQRFGIEPLAEHGGAFEVAEDDGHCLAHLVRWQRGRGSQWRAAVTAQPELRRVLLAATGTSNHVARV
jgi:hypothetical protein